MLAYRISASPPHVELREVEEPVPSPNETLVRVRAFSLNRGEVLDLAARADGAAVGWDFAGVATTGERVVGVVRGGAWAELVAVPASQLAVVPDGVSDAEAATLPTAGLTALRSLELGGFLLGKRVLVTGARGGVGGYAVQLAALGGASVTALVRNVETSVPGAARVIDRIADEFDLVVDAVGGETFAAAIEHVAPGGLVVNLATGSPDEVVSFRAARFDRAPGARIYTLNLFDELPRMDAAKSLGRLADLLAQRRLTAPVALEAPWQELDHAIDTLLNRWIGGKAVLHVG
ncbi:MAG: zinc-binding dehydrogenase [Actinobacteria bacterium]|nr:MAG: zinc-binding dehydrogenase [Actinomycetota bacterium]